MALLSQPTLLAAGWLLFQPRLGQLKLALQGGIEVYGLFEVPLRVLAPGFPVFPGGCDRAAPGPHLCGGADPERREDLKLRRSCSLQLLSWYLGLSRLQDPSNERSCHSRAAPRVGGRSQTAAGRSGTCCAGTLASATLKTTKANADDPRRPEHV